MEVQELSSFPDILKAAKRMNLVVCLFEQANQVHSAVQIALFKASFTAWRVNITENTFSQSV